MMKKKFFIAITILLTIYTAISILTPLNVIAQAPTKDSSSGLGCGGGLGPLASFLCNDVNAANATEKVGGKLNRVVSAIIGFLTVVAGLWFFFQFLLAAFQWIGAGGDKNKVEEVRNKMTYSLLGIIVVVASWIIIGLIGTLLGFEILNPGSLLGTLGI